MKNEINAILVINGLQLVRQMNYVNIYDESNKNKGTNAKVDVRSTSSPKGYKQIKLWAVPHVYLVV